MVSEVLSSRCITRKDYVDLFQGQDFEAHEVYLFLPSLLCQPLPSNSDKQPYIFASRLYLYHMRAISFRIHLTNKQAADVLVRRICLSKLPPCWLHRPW